MQPKLTDRQQKILATIRRSTDWQLLGSWNQQFRNDINCLWMDDLIMLSDDMQYVKPNLDTLHISDFN